MDSAIADVRPRGRVRSGLQIATLVLSWSLGVSSAIAGMSVPPVAVALPTGAWVGDFSIPAFDGRVNACAIHQGAYVVGGAFEWAGGIPVHNVAVWTGSAWAPLGVGLPSRVRKLASRGADLFAATDSYESSVSPVMRYDGGTWRPVGSGLYGEVDALLVDGPFLYAAGQLLLIGLSNACRVVCWDGVQWLPVGGEFDNRIQSLAMFGGELHAGGDFLHAEGTLVSRIARWDGTHWRDVGGGTGAGGSTIAALAVYQDRLIAGGGFVSIGGTDTQGIAAWDGVAWQALPNLPQDVFVHDLEVEGALLHVGGVLQVPYEYASGLVTFDGQSWRPPTPYPSWGVEDLAVGDGVLLAVGTFAQLSQPMPPSMTPARDVVVRDPVFRPLAAWAPTMRGLLGPGWTAVQALHAHQGELYAGGYFEYGADPPAWTRAMGLGRWDGSAWRTVNDERWGWTQAMTTWRELLVVSNQVATSGTMSSVAGWDGTAWNDLGGPIQGWVGELLDWNGALVAGGYLNLPFQTDHFAVAINHGSGWARLGTIDPANQPDVTALGSFGGDLFVGGHFVIPGFGMRGIARWNGSSWTEVPGAPEMQVLSMLTRIDGLWVAGYNSMGSAVWRWDGRSWTAVGEIAGTAYQLVEMGDLVIACGAFATRDGPTTIVRWDGETWHALPDAPDQAVVAAAVVGRDLWVGGWFTHAGGRQAEAIACWRLDPPPAPSVLQMAPPWPSPASDHVTFRFALPVEGPVELRIFDLRGALVARAIDEHLPAGTHERTWSMASAPERIRPGIYFARLVTPAGTAGARVVIAPASAAAIPWSP